MKTNTELARELSDILTGYTTIDGRAPVCRVEVGDIKWLAIRDASMRLLQIGDGPTAADKIRAAGMEELARWPDGPKADGQDRCARNAVHSLCRRLGVEL